MSEKKLSLVLITVDCLRADHCGFYGYARPTTPFLDSLSAEAVVVPAAVVAGAPTYYSLPAIFASRMPLALGRDVVGLAPGEETLATVLREAGYATAAFSAANPYISRRFGYEQGFGEFRDFLGFDSASHAGSLQDSSTPDESKQNRGAQAVSSRNGLGGAADADGRTSRGSGRSILTHSRLNRWLMRSARVAGLERIYEESYFQYRMRIAASPVGSMDELRRFPSATALVESAESWLRSVDGQPFFLWLHFMDPHSPYYPTATAFRQLAGAEITPGRARYLNEFWNRSDLSSSGYGRHREEVIDLYDAGIRTVDNEIARLVGFLEDSHRWEDCVFALTADHGEEFLDHGRRYHAPVSLAEEIARVPLFIRVPGTIGERAPARLSMARPFSHLHLAPTLLDTLGVSQPDSFRGKSRRIWEEDYAADDMRQEREDVAIAECVNDCKNPFEPETLMAPRLLSVRDARYKLVMRLEPGRAEELYNLQADPAEKNPMPRGQSPETRKRFLQIALRHLESNVSGRPFMARLKIRLRDVRLKLDA